VGSQRTLGRGVRPRPGVSIMSTPLIIDELPDGVVPYRGRRVFDELLKCLIELPGLVVQHQHVCIPRHVVDVIGYGASPSIESVALRRSTLGADHARQLMEQALQGTAFPTNQLRSFEVLLDNRQANYHSMLIHHRLKDINDPRLLNDGAPVGVLNATIVGVLLDGADQKLGEDRTTVVGLAQNQLDIMLFGNSHERIERLVVIAAQKAAGGNEQHPAMHKLKTCIARLILRPEKSTNAMPLS
jgi:hypothetical protein